MIHGILNEVGCCAGPNVLITCEVVSSPEPVPEDAWHDASLRRLATVSTCTGSGETAVTTTPQGHALTVMPTVAADGLHVDLEWELALHTPAGPQQFEGHFFLADRATILLPIANPGAEHRYLLLSVRFLHWSGKPYRPLDWR